MSSPFSLAAAILEYLVKISAVFSNLPQFTIIVGCCYLAIFLNCHS